MVKFMKLKIIVLPILISLPGFAYSSSTALDSKQNKALLMAEKQQASSVFSSQSNECSNTNTVDIDGNPSTLGGVAAQILNKKLKQAQTPINFDQTFSTAKEGGCFDVIHNMPDFSLSIPSLSDISSAVQSTLKNYATKKVCSAVNATIENAVGGLRNKLQSLSDSGQLDLSGRVNRQISQKAYSIDSGLGNQFDQQNSTSNDKTYKFSW